MPDWPKEGQGRASPAGSVGYPPDRVSARGEAWKALKTTQDGVTIEIRPIEHTIRRRGWEVRSSPGFRTFHVWVTGRALRDTPAGARPHGRDWSECEIERGIAHAVERALVSASSDAPTEISLASHDLYAANGRL